MPSDMRHSPPTLANFLIRLLSEYEHRFSIEGDLLEGYDYKCRSLGVKKARRWYWQQTIKTAFHYSHFIMRGAMAMVKNHFKIAFRNIKRQPGYSLINIFGLAVGMACSILILLWVQDELGFDNSQKNGNHIYRVIRHIQAENMVNDYVMMPNALAPALEANFPEVKYAVRYSKVSWPMMAEGTLYSNVDMCLADSTFFKMFTFKAVQGNLIRALKTPTSLVITESMAQKCFGNADPLGKTITGLGVDYRIAAVIENPPKNSHIQFECVMPLKYERTEYLQSWHRAWQYVVYVQFHENAFHPGLEDKVATLIKENHPEGQRMNLDITLQPFRNIHLRSPWDDRGMNVGEGNITYVYLFSLIAFCILLVACVNYMSLSTARSSKRQKEIGMRKVAGAQRHHIIRQFFGESLLMSFSALLVALLLIAMALPIFNTFTGKWIQMGQLLHVKSIGSLILVTLFTALVAGSYPAFFLSSFLPIKVLKGARNNHQTKGATFRSVLVVGQIAFTTLLITASLVIYSQLRYIQNKDLGYDKEQILGFHSGSLRQNYEAFKNELITHPGVISITRSQAPTWIGAAYGETDRFTYPGRNLNDGVKLFQCHTDFDFMKTFDIRLANGRFFNKKFAADSSNYLLNETAVKALGLESPLGKPFTFQDRPGIIIGIIKDFHFSSLHSEIKPVVFHATPGWNIYIKISSHHMTETLKHLKTVWEKHRLEGLFDLDYYFLDEAVSQFYLSENNMSKVFRAFTLLAVFISCLGLLGLASFMAEQRVKEIGIRKTLGASLSSLILLLSKTFIKWVIIANVIAIPIAWYSMNRWLNTFSYHADFRPEIFLLTGLSGLAIVLISAGYQTVKAASKNPIESLKCE